MGEYELIEVAGERVDSVVQEDVLLMKLDVEGFEPTAFQSSKGILDSFRWSPRSRTFLAELAAGRCMLASAAISCITGIRVSHPQAKRMRNARGAPQCTAGLLVLGVLFVCPASRWHKICLEEVRGHLSWSCLPDVASARCDSVQHIIMEYSPGVYDVGKRWDEYLDWPKMLI